MPFSQDAKNNLVVSLTLANVFTDKEGQYLPLSELFHVIPELQRCIGWQMHHLYDRAHPGRNSAKDTLSLYISLESSVDLFMRYMNIPTCKVHDNLAYLDDKVQKLIYQLFKEKLLRKSLYEPKQPSPETIRGEVRNLVKEKVQGYAIRPSKQKKEDRIFDDDEMWEIFVAEVDVGIQKLSDEYNTIISNFHKEFADFRKGQLKFILNYFDRCLFLTRLENWLNQAPSEQNHPRVEDARITAFCEKLKILAEQNYLEHDLSEFSPTLDSLKTKTLNQAQYKELAQCLIRLKPKYDIYCKGQDKLSPEDQLKKMLDAWPKPKLPSWTPKERNEVTHAWDDLRAKHRKRQEKEVTFKTEGRKRKLM